ncbi:unnamed protein product [Bursaphelenchus xylophilus]|uniref:(pine wood nematode) hypothetical protein n=1 Tax=Bursaphelenchus xylophilus TaxID=6326 RepID=A0A1I7SFM0_BURXY|nr:unnamed protein product [Bursaphelenchus xylophilus]CAG9112936.1 unnamed protein product [Bursaphelenchus xylophilus]
MNIKYLFSKAYDYLYIILTDESPYCYNHDSPLPDNYKVFYVIDAAELLIIFVSFVVVSINVYVFLSVKIFHRNTVRMFGCMIWTFPAMQMTRIHVIYVYWSKGRPVASLDYFFNCNPEVQFSEYLRFGFMISYYVALCTLTFERLIATVFLETYEKKEFWWTVFVTLALQAFFCALAVYFITIRFMSTTFIFTIALLFQWTLILIFLYCKRTNERRYMQSKLYNHKYRYSLTAMFQLSDNIRAIKCMVPGIIIVTALNSLASASYFATILSVDIFWRRLWLTLFNATICSYAAVAATIPIYFTDVYRARLIVILKTSSRWLQTGRITPFEDRRKTLKTLGGTQMVFALEDEGNIYFQTLISSWK